MPRRLTLAASSGNAFSWVWSPRLTMWSDAESVDIGQLRFGRLTGCRYPIIETTPVIDRFRIGHGTPLLGSSSCLPHWGRSTVLPIWRGLIAGQHTWQRAAHARKHQCEGSTRRDIPRAPPREAREKDRGGRRFRPYHEWDRDGFLRH